MKIRRGLFFALIVCVSLAHSQTSTITSVGSSEPSNVLYANYQVGTISSVGHGIKVWSFVITDGIGDDLPTELAYMIIKGKNGGSITDLGPVIRSAALFHGSLLLDETEVIGQVMEFLPASYFTVAEGQSDTLHLYVTFESTVTDNANIQYAIQDAQSSDTYTVEFGNSTSFDDPYTGDLPESDVSGDKNRLEVTATQLVFSGEPFYVNPDSLFSVTVTAKDANGSTDLDATTSVTVTKNFGSGNLSGGGAQSLSSGTYTWTTLSLDTEDPTVNLTTSNDGGLIDNVSANIEVTSALFVEDFPYAQNASLTDNSWTAFGFETTTNTLTTLGSGLSYTGYGSSGRGNSVDMSNGGGQDVYRNFTAQSGDSLYLSFMTSVNLVGSSGSQLVSLGLPTPTGMSDIRLVVFARYSVGSGMAFGLSKNGGTGTSLATWSSYDYDQGPTYLIVAKYVFKDGTNNDVASLYVNPTLNGNEPASPTIIANATGDEADAAQLGSVAVIQIAGGADAVVDGIRVAKEWSPTALPVQLASFSAASAGLNARLTWSTSTETDNAGFEVERRSISDFGPSTSLGASLSGVDYQKVGFVPGAGTSTSPREYAYTDANLAPGRYAYRLKQVDRDGSSTYYREAEVEVGLTAKAFTLNEAFPNPFNPSTSIDFSLADAGVASVRIYDVLGREVATVFNGAAEAGRLYRATWDASSMPSGMYFARLESGGSSALKRLMLVK